MLPIRDLNIQAHIKTVRKIFPLDTNSDEDLDSDQDKLIPYPPPSDDNLLDTDEDGGDGDNDEKRKEANGDIHRSFDKLDSDSD